MDKDKVKKLIGKVDLPEFPVDKITALIDKIPTFLFDIAAKQLENTKSMDSLKNIPTEDIIQCTKTAWKLYKQIRPLLKLLIKNPTYLEVVSAVVSILSAIIICFGPYLYNKFFKFQNQFDKALKLKVKDPIKNMIEALEAVDSKNMPDSTDWIEIDCRNLLEEIANKIKSLLPKKSIKDVVEYLELYAEFAVSRNTILLQMLVLSAKKKDRSYEKLSKLAESEVEMDANVMSVITNENDNIFLKAYLLCSIEPHETLLQCLMIESFKFDLEAYFHQQCLALRTIGYLHSNWHVSVPKLSKKSIMYMECKNRKSSIPSFLFIQIGHNCFCITPKGVEFKNYLLYLDDNFYVQLKKVDPEVSPPLNCHWLVLPVSSGFVIIPKKDPMKILSMSNYGWNFKCWLFCKEISRQSENEVWTLEKN